MMNKFVFFIFCSLISMLLFSQNDTTIKYYSKEYLHKETTEKKGKFILYITETNDTIEKHELFKKKTGQLMWTKFYKNKKPWGKWKLYDDWGKLERELDYEFELVYMPDSVFEIRQQNMQPFIPNNGFPELVDERPMFQGGDFELQKFLAYNTNYPVYARENGIQGRVYVCFLITESEEIKNVRILKGVEETLDREAVRVFISMPNWIPAKKNGKNVACEFSMPFTFVLQ